MGMPGGTVKGSSAKPFSHGILAAQDGRGDNLEVEHGTDR
jgi:hypothetical protein